MIVASRYQNSTLLRPNSNLARRYPSSELVNSVVATLARATNALLR
jgi:hypothetical protein